MYGAEFQVSNSANFSSGVMTIYTVASIPVSGQFTTVVVNPGAAYRYIRYAGGMQGYLDPSTSANTPALRTLPLTRL